MCECVLVYVILFFFRQFCYYEGKKIFFQIYKMPFKRFDCELWVHTHFFLGLLAFFLFGRGICLRLLWGIWSPARFRADVKFSR